MTLGDAYHFWYELDKLLFIHKVLLAEKLISL